ncbi:MAG TPA: type II secretion system secretin GspD [Alphaproteobacteria bacterium]|nr:type II secretion system secretin GspD [Alphaproteobacteria bacterium]
MRLALQRHGLNAAFVFLAAMSVLAGCAPEQRARPVVSAPPVSETPPEPQAGPAITSTRPPAKPIEEYYPAPAEPSSGTSPRMGLAAGDISLNFQNASINEIASVILGDILKTPFTIDAGVQGSATISTGTPLNREALIPVLEAILSSMNAVLVNQAGMYRIRPASGSDLQGAPVGAALPSGTGAGFEVFALSYIGAAEMAKLIAPLVPDGRPVSVDAQRNLLIVGGTGPERQSVRETIALFDVDAMANQSVLLISLENVPVKTILFELENIFGDTGKGPLAGLVRFIPLERLNALMVLSAQDAYLTQARDWIRRLDRTRRADEQTVFVYFMQHGSAPEMVKTLQEVFSPRSAPTDAGAQQAPAGQADELVIPPSAGLVSGLAQEPLRITADRSKNALLIQGNERQYQQVKDVLGKLDIAPLQVMIEAQIIEVSLGDTLRYGVQYFLDTGGLKIDEDSITQLTAGTSGTGIAPNLSAAPGGGFAFSLTGRSGQNRVVLDALSDMTNVNMISAPTLFVLDNQVARLRVGDEVPIITQTADGLTNDSRTLNTVQYRSTGVLLEVTPQVNSGGMVTLQIVQEVSAAVNTQSSGSSTINSPTIQQRSFLSTVGVRDGETILLGGLIREQASKGRSGIPVLHQVPVLGNLFGRTSNSAARTELLVMITPRVVRNTQQNRDVTAAIREKYQGILALQARGAERPRTPYGE